MLKRIFDLTAAGAAIFVLSPLLIPVTIALRLTGEGEIFYRQERIGQHGKVFGILKFATMLKDSPNLVGGDITVGNDPRVLPFGRFLRKSKINELPQLFNIMLGDMSLIGPRPLTKRIAGLFDPRHWAAINHLRPGLSGIGSIVFRDEERLLDEADDRATVYAEVIVPYKAELERWYAQRQSLAMDIRLVLLTVLAVLQPTLNVSQYLRDLPAAPTALQALRARQA